MKSTLQVLRDARKLLIENGWTQGASARNICGVVVAINSRHAVSFCASGAVERSSGRDAIDISVLRNALPRGAWGGSVVAYNDTARRTKEQVIKLFDRAIENEERRNVISEKE